MYLDGRISPESERKLNELLAQSLAVDRANETLERENINLRNSANEWKEKWHAEHEKRLEIARARKLL